MVLNVVGSSPTTHPHKRDLFNKKVSLIFLRVYKQLLLTIDGLVLSNNNAMVY